MDSKVQKGIYLLFILEVMISQFFSFCFYVSDYCLSTLIEKNTFTYSKFQGKGDKLVWHTFLAELLKVLASSWLSLHWT